MISKILAVTILALIITGPLWILLPHGKDQEEIDDEIRKAELKYRKARQEWCKFTLRRDANVRSNLAQRLLQNELKALEELRRVGSDQWDRREHDKISSLIQA